MITSSVLSLYCIVSTFCINIKLFIITYLANIVHIMEPMLLICAYNANCNLLILTYRPICMYARVCIQKFQFQY